jgi:hypothetical protein
MSVQDMLRGDAADLDREAEYVSGEIEALEAKIVKARERRDDLRFRRGSMLAAAQLLDSHGFKVERDPAGVVTVSVDPHETVT